MKLFETDQGKRIKQLETQLKHCQKALNEIDDYFEHRMESKRDQKQVHFILANLTSNLS